MGSLIFGVLGILVLVAFCVMLGTTVVKAIRNTRFRIPLLSTIVLFFLTLACAVVVVSVEPSENSHSKLKFNGNVAQADVNHYVQNKMDDSKEVDYKKFTNGEYSHDQLLKVSNAKVNKISDSSVGDKIVEVSKGSGQNKESYFIIDYDHKQLEKGQTYTFYGKEDLKYDDNSQLHSLNVTTVE